MGQEDFKDDPYQEQVITTNLKGETIFSADPDNPIILGTVWFLLVF